MTTMTDAKAGIPLPRRETAIRTRATGGAESTGDPGPGFDLADALGEIQARFKIYAESGSRALGEALAIGHALRRIKSSLFAAAPASGTKNITWETWCGRTHSAGELPFGRRQADRYVQLWENRDRLRFESDAASLRAGIAQVGVGSKSRATRERWTSLYVCREPGTESVHASSRGRLRICWPHPNAQTPLLPPVAPKQPGKELATADTATSANEMRIPPERASQAVRAAARAFMLALGDPESARKLNRFLDELAQSQPVLLDAKVPTDASPGGLNRAPETIAAPPGRKAS